MINIRRSSERGKAQFDWLKSQHTFSFGNYYDEKHMGYSALRVINDDEVIAGAGFPTHGHRDMEIISYVLEGEIAHRDSEGNITRLPAGEFQLMSAGSGIQHSEFNASKQHPLKFLQIWIQPNVYGQEPGYQQKDFGRAEGLTLIASPGGKQGSLILKQDASLYQLILSPNGTATLNNPGGRRYYVHVISGKVHAEGEVLRAGDGAKIEASKLALAADAEPVQALVFDLPD
jgi:redox-sensitive bicupin YhaK (pirin superfamily)